MGEHFEDRKGCSGGGGKKKALVATLEQKRHPRGRGSGGGEVPIFNCSLETMFRLCANVKSHLGKEFHLVTLAPNLWNGRVEQNDATSLSPFFPLLSANVGIKFPFCHLPLSMNDDETFHHRPTGPDQHAHM